MYVDLKMYVSRTVQDDVLGYRMRGWEPVCLLPRRTDRSKTHDNDGGIGYVNWDGTSCRVCYAQNLTLTPGYPYEFDYSGPVNRWQDSHRSRKFMLVIKDDLSLHDGVSTGKRVQLVLNSDVSVGDMWRGSTRSTCLS